MKQITQNPQKQLEKFEKFFEVVASNVIEGDIDALPAYGTLDSIEKACKLVKEKIKKTALTEFSKSKDGSQNLVEKGFWQFSEMNVTSYDYSKDEIWNDLETQINTLKEKQKERESLLKATKENEKDENDNIIVFIDVSNEGVEFERKPPLKKVTQTLSVKRFKISK